MHIGAWQTVVVALLATCATVTRATTSVTLDASTMSSINMDPSEYSWDATTPTTMYITNAAGATDPWVQGFASTVAVSAAPGSYMEWDYHTTHDNYVIVGASTNNDLAGFDRIAWGIYFMWGDIDAEEYDDDSGVNDGGTLTRTESISDSNYKVTSRHFKLSFVEDATDNTRVKAN